MKQIELTDAEHEKLIEILVDARDMGPSSGGWQSPVLYSVLSGRNDE